ncbi:pyridoxal 5'-phosphate synthase lyase subunit PdxS [Sulfolobales archaeon HS-7]|nr:pyridoxal 5'-phosphate synthase lyase subunit PdxS [Sulfolobales archaeon HS-7]
MKGYSISFFELENFFYKLVELRDSLKYENKRKGADLYTVYERISGSNIVKHAFPIFQKGGVVMDVTNVEQASIAEDAGAISVMVLDKLPYDVRKMGGVARMADPKIIEEVMNSITIPVMAKVRIGHEMEARILETLGVDMIDESEVLTPADETHHIDKWRFKVPFVNGTRNLGESLRRISEGASMLRTKGEPGTGNVSEAVKHMRIMNKELEEIASLNEGELITKSREIQVPFEILQLTQSLGRLPIVNFAAGGIATPADAALMMWLGSDGIFVGSGIFKSQDPAERGSAIVLATSNWDKPEIVLEAQKMISEYGSMTGIDIRTLKPEELMQVRGV